MSGARVFDTLGAIRLASESARKDGRAWYVVPALDDEYGWAVCNIPTQARTGYRCESDGRVIAYAEGVELVIASVFHGGKVHLHEPRKGAA